MISTPTTWPCTWATKACSATPSCVRTKHNTCKFTCVCVCWHLPVSVRSHEYTWSGCRSNYRFWSCGGDSWGVSQRGESVQLNSHQSVRWHTRRHIPRYSNTIIPSSSHTPSSKTIIMSFEKLKGNQLQFERSYFLYLLFMIYKHRPYYRPV